MNFVAVVDQVITLLRQCGRVTYRTLQRQFQLDADALADLLAELRYAYRDELLEEEQGVLWVGDTRSTLSATTAPAAQTALAPRTYTPAYLAEQILTSRSALEGERKRVTVLFADLKDSMELLAEHDPEEARQLLDPVLTAATLRLVEELVRVPGLGPVPVKGLAEPVEVFELVGVTALQRRLQAAAARGLSPFMGMICHIRLSHVSPFRESSLTPPCRG
jgi:hypothetical protein